MSRRPLNMPADRRRYRRDEDGVRRVVSVINGVEGYWSKFTESCSGCCELGDYCGMAHLYEYDDKHGCHVGAGCSECGYTGKRVERFFVPFDLKDFQRLGEERNDG